MAMDRSYQSPIEVPPESRLDEAAHVAFIRHIREGQPEIDGLNLCAICGRRFYHRDVTVDVCRDCWTRGKHDERRLARVMEAVRCVDPDASVVNTGGNCMVIEVPMCEAGEDGNYARYCYMTDWADGIPDDDGMSEGQRWVVGYYDLTPFENDPDAWNSDDEFVCGLGMETDESAPGGQRGATLMEALEWMWARSVLEQIKDEFVAGQLGEWRPSEGFEGLHQVCDANEYLEPAFFYTEEREDQIERANRIIELVDNWLAKLEVKLVEKK